jgi:hypothetical protein
MQLRDLQQGDISYRQVFERIEGDLKNIECF